MTPPDMIYAQIAKLMTQLREQNETLVVIREKGGLHPEISGFSGGVKWDPEMGEYKSYRKKHGKKR